MPFNLHAQTLYNETLGNFPEHRSWLVTAIDAALASESDEHVRKVLAESKERLREVVSARLPWVADERSRP